MFNDLYTQFWLVLSQIYMESKFLAIVRTGAGNGLGFAVSYTGRTVATLIFGSVVGSAERVILGNLAPQRIQLTSDGPTPAFLGATIQVGAGFYDC
jgi:hypothetical protein